MIKINPIWNNASVFRNKNNKQKIKQKFEALIKIDSWFLSPIVLSVNELTKIKVEKYPAIVSAKK